MAFEGFSDETFRFLRGLRRNNDKAWFDAHRSDYEEHVREPGMAFIEAVGPLIERFSPQVRADPRVGGSMMRINRDIRFSRDKRPYKDHLDMTFRRGEAKGSPGYWFRLRPDALVLGAGMHMLDKLELERYRRAVDAEASGAALTRTLAKVERAGYELGGEHYKRVPAGFASDHPREALLRHNGVYVGSEMDAPAEVTSATFPSFCAGHFRRMAPLVDWLQANVA